MMMGVLGWTPSDLDRCTLRTVIIAYESRLVNDWNHTAQVTCVVYNLMVMVSHLGGKSKLKAESPLRFHPLLRNQQKKGYAITKKNFKELKSVFGAAMGGNVRSIT